MKSLQLAIMMLWLSAFTAKSQEMPNIPQFSNEIVLVRTLEQLGTFLSETLEISDGSEVKYSDDLASLKGKNQAANAKKLALIFNQLKAQGYRMIATNSGGGGSALVVITNYIFEKERER